MKQLASILTLSVCLFTGCVTTTVNPDGTTQFTDVDYSSIQLLSSAAVAAWAATQKDGIKPSDAEALVTIIDVLENSHKDGSPLDLTAWAAAVKADVPVRYQALTMVMAQLIEMQLRRYGVAEAVPTLNGTTAKILDAVRTGAKLALTPYLNPKA